MKRIKLGDKVRCKHSGFTGIAVAKTEFINGCVQFNVLPKVKKHNEPIEDIGIDEDSLEVVITKKKKTKSKANGGPMRKGNTFRGF